MRLSASSFLARSVVLQQQRHWQGTLAHLHANYLNEKIESDGVPAKCTRFDNGITKFPQFAPFCFSLLLGLS